MLFNNRMQAQEINVDGEFRINPVYSRGFRRPLYTGEDPGFFTMQRTRLMFNYSKPKDLDAEIVLQDRRFWGDQGDRDDVPNMALYRGWVEKYFTPQFSIRLGRQGFVYDDQYLLGDPNWVGTRAHDAALLRYETDSSHFKAHLALAFNANGQEFALQPFEQSIYKNMQFLWLHKDFRRAKISFIVLNRGMESGGDSISDIRYTQTFGPDISIGLSKRLTLKGLFYYQVGQDAHRKDVSAYFYSAQLVYTATNWLEFNPGVDAGSGTNQSDLDNPNYTKSHTFDRHYGLIHGHFGYIDYFYVNRPTLCGVQDFYLKTKVKATSKLSIEDHVHYFLTSAKINDAAHDNVPMNNYLGIENDILINYKVSSLVKASIGHSIMFGTSTLNQFFGGRKPKDMQVVYAVITATPNFFKSKK